MKFIARLHVNKELALSGEANINKITQYVLKVGQKYKDDQNKYFYETTQHYKIIKTSIYAKFK